MYNLIHSSRSLISRWTTTFLLPLCPQPFEKLHPTLVLSILIYYLPISFSVFLLPPCTVPRRIMFASSYVSIPSQFTILYTSSQIKKRMCMAAFQFQIWIYFVIHRVDSFKRDGQFISAVSNQGSLCIWDRNSGNLLGSTKSKITTCASISASHRSSIRLLVGEIHGCLHMYSSSSSA